MATDQNNQPVGRQPVTPAKRRILQQQFEVGSKASASGNWDYATDMFTSCVRGDPGNRMYAQSFLGNLQKKYNNNKKGSNLAGIRGAGSKGSLRKSAMQKNWPGVLESGLELLKLNPWDAAALTSVADALSKLECEEAEIVFLRGAVEADMNNPDTNRLLGRALGKQGEFDQAIMCWNRVLKAKPADDEGRKAIADLTVEKTINRGGYEGAETSTDVMADKQAKAERQGTGARFTEEQQLERAIAKAPADVSKYVELADLHQRNENFAAAEEVLTKALAVSGGEMTLRERIEDMQLRRQRQQVEVAHKRFTSERTPEAEALFNQMKVELNNKEMEVYRIRCDRYPTQTGLKFQLAVRLQRAEKFREAIGVYQECRADPQRKGVVQLSIGECFQHIKQYPLAMTQYEAAIGDIPEREIDLKKQALYRAGKLAVAGLKPPDLDKAEKYLTELAGLDFGFKDVAELLDKIRRLRDKG